GFVGITLWYFGRDLPDYQQLAHYQPPIMTRVHAGDGRLLAEYATERRIFVPIQAIPKPVINAFLSAEDKNFYNHHGVDPVSHLFLLNSPTDDPRRGRCPRPNPAGAEPVQPGTLPTDGKSSPRLGPGPDSRRRSNHPGRGGAGRSSAARASPPARGGRGQSPLFRRGGQARPAGPIWRKGSVRRWAVGAHQSG